MPLQVHLHTYFGLLLFWFYLCNEKFFRFQVLPYIHKRRHTHIHSTCMYFLCIKISIIIRSWFRSDWTRHKSSWTLSLCKFGYEYTHTHKTNPIKWTAQINYMYEMHNQISQLVQTKHNIYMQKGENKIII